MSNPFSRAAAATILLGAAMVASPLAARAGGGTPAPARFGQAAAAPGQTTLETVDQRIATLHTDLKITPAEEPQWSAVAQTMRDNAAAMQKLVSQREAAGEGMTAVEDLQMYQKFAETHVTDLAKLTTAFTALYQSMPPAQKKVADQVFTNFGHHGTTAHG